MRRLFALFLFAIVAVACHGAQAQYQPVVPLCGQPPAPCTASNPMPISGGGGGGSITANQGTAGATPWPENVAQINGVTPLMGAGNTGTGSPRVTVSTDQAALPAAGQGATGAAVPAGATQIGVSVGGNLVPIIGGSCETNARTFTPINISTATTTRIIAPASAKRTYICGMFLWAAAADNVGIVEGTGGTCGTGTAGIVGGTTAATGLVMAAQNAFVMTSTGFAQMATAGTNVDFCLITSAAVQLSGHVVWVQAP